MASDSAAASGRPRPWLLVALAVAIVGFVATRMWPSTSVLPMDAAAPVGAPARGEQKPLAADDLEVRLEALNTPRPDPGVAQRNPFRFQPKPAAPSPPAPRLTPQMATVPPVAGPPPVPPITLKFIGVVEGPGVKVAALSDCRSTYHGHEGAIVDGRYRLVRIGVESVVIEYVDGRGRITLRNEGCAPR